MDDLNEEIVVLTKKASNTGIITLAPKKIRTAISGLMDTLREIARKSMAEEDASALVIKGRSQLKQISVDIRKIVGTYELGGE
jgi:hypothetical protein